MSADRAPPVWPLARARGGLALALVAVGSALAQAAGPPPDETFDPTFEPCAHCHEIGRNARSATGPSLEGLVGRRAGTLAGYPFSPAMRASGLIWDKVTLDRFIAAPQSLVPGTRMILPGIEDGVLRARLVAFIARAGGPAPAGKP